LPIEEFLSTALSSGAPTELFRFELEAGLYTASFSENYVAISINQEFTPPGNNIRAQRPGPIHVFNGQGRVTTLRNDSNSNYFRITPEADLIILNTVSGDHGFSSQIFNMEGMLIHEITGKGHLNLSPSAQFAFTAPSMESTRPLNVYDLTGENLFNVPTRGEYQAAAVSDSLLALAQGNTVSLWNVYKKTKLWESQIPREGYHIDTAYKILHSEKANIIVVRDMLGCYCYDLGGSLLWHREGIEAERFINSVGLSDEDGTVAISGVFGDRVQIDLMDREGELDETIDFDFQAGERFGINWGMVIDVHPDLLISRFALSTGTHRVLVSALAVRADGNWVPKFVDGPWFVLRGEDSQVLVGKLNESMTVKGYAIKLGR
jgi:hypothetical protein